MTDKKRDALIESLRNIPINHDTGPYQYIISGAAYRISADGKYINKLKQKLENIENAAYQRGYEEAQRGMRVMLGIYK